MDASIPAFQTAQIPDVLVPKLGINEEAHALIFSEDDDADLARHMKSELNDKGFKCFTKDDILEGRSVPDAMGEFLSKCSKVIVVISKASLSKDGLASNTARFLSESRSEGKVRIPVIHNIELNKIPSYIKEVNYIETTDCLFWERLAKSLSTAIGVPSASLPTSNIAEGLAWGYFYNFLKVILPGLETRMDKKYENSGKQYLRKFILLMPQSGHCRNLDEIDSYISYDKEPLKFTRTVAGATRRDYSNTVVKIMDVENQKEFYAVIEFATPLETMYEMYMGQIAGLDKEGKKAEMAEFIHLLQEILNHDNNKEFHGMIIPLAYDDESEEVRQNPHYLSSKILTCIKQIQENV